jgi:NTP pyrophosphatase (non-canonical NTP hydrolase)
MTAINRITHNDVIEFDRYACGDGNALNHYQRLATKSAIYPGQGTPLGLAYVALKLNGEAGEFAEHVGKAMRDDGLLEADVRTGNIGFGADLTPARRLALIKEIGDQLWYLSAACNELGITLSDAALTNLQKLADRTERETLRGSGDDR